MDRCDKLQFYWFYCESVFSIILYKKAVFIYKPIIKEKLYVFQTYQPIILQEADSAIPDHEMNTSKTDVNSVTAANFKVIGYLPSWADEVNHVQFSKLTHVNYAIILPSASGSFKPLENPSKLQSLVIAVHAKNGL